MATRAPELTPWLPLLGAVIDVEIEATPDVEMLAEKNRRMKLHETVARFLEAMVPDRLLIEIENAHDMDEASAELLSYLTGELAARPWLFAVARRPSGTGAAEARRATRRCRDAGGSPRRGSAARTAAAR